jgi:type II secretory ATPase GspE/PulE/Tfp pilus assembly ATPase PilB-like protein
MNDALRKHVQSGVSSDAFRAIAIKNGMAPLSSSGVALARKKLVSIAEVYRACM